MTLVQPEGAREPAIDGGPAELWPDGAADRLRERWRELQLRFVDDPRAAARDASDVFDETIKLLNSSMQVARAELDEWRA